VSQYLLRKGKHFYEIAKFEDSDSPTAVYLFTKRGCGCPAGRRDCKHTKILKAWQQAGEVIGFVYNDEASHIASLPLA
jgi:hypothetical protein